MMSSRSTRHALRRPTARTPNRPRMAIHQMCQTKANPMSVTHTAIWKPRALLLGTLRDCNAAVDAAEVPRCLRLQKASGPDTIGKMEKFQLGGGEDTDHS